MLALSIQPDKASLTACLAMHSTGSHWNSNGKNSPR